MTKDTVAWRVIIDYHFKRDDGKDIPTEHVPQLEKDAMERIHEMMKEGYVQGELFTTVITEDDKEVEYSGWWGTKTEERKDD